MEKHENNKPDAERPKEKKIKYKRKVIELLKTYWVQEMLELIVCIP